MRSLLAAICLSAFVLGVAHAAELPGYSRHTDRSALWSRSGDLLSGFRNMYQFDVVATPEDAAWPWKAWVFGWAAEDGNPNASGCDAIYMVRGKTLSGPWEVHAGEDTWDDGTHPAAWEAVISARDFYFDQWHNGDPTVVRRDGRYYLAYSSTGHNKDGIPYGIEGDTDGSTLCVMGAVSEDGIHWTKAERAILEHKEDFGAPSWPTGEAHLFGSYHRPSLLWDEGKWKLWFDYWTGAVTGTSVGYAENSGDFLKAEDWRLVRAGDTPALPQFPNPDVVKTGGVYFAYGDPPTGHPHPWISRKLTEAVSLDGVDWMVVGYVEPDVDAPAIHVPQALVAEEEGKTFIYVFYACQIGGDPEYDYRYNRIRWMRREVTEKELAAYRAVLAQR